MISNFLKRLPFLKKTFEIYTDGSSKNGWGSWAFVVVCNQGVLHESSGRTKKTSCNRMELQAAIEALRWLQSGSRVTLYSDSRILIDALDETSNKNSSLYNSDLFEILKNLSTKHFVTWTWIKSHSGNVYNERCDELCTLARKS